jgi:hypothetical protein
MVDAGPRLDYARDAILDAKVITKHRCTKEKKKTYTKPLYVVSCFFASFFLFFFLLFLYFFQGSSNLNSRTKMLLMSDLSHTLFLERIGVKW